MPRALMAKLHSWFSAKSLRCCSFITECTVSRVCSGDICVLVTGMILPLTFIDGGTPAVMNRSEPPFSTIRRSSFSNSMEGSRYYKNCPAVARPKARLGARDSELEVFRRLGFLAGVLAGDQALGHQALETGIQGLHAQRAAGLRSEERRVGKEC